MTLARRTLFALSAFAGIIGTAHAASPTMFRDA